MKKYKNLRKYHDGFTIIEVMIVLAIAGLIMVIVLVAAPQLQRTQRNTARKDIANRVKTELDAYAGNNQGSIPNNTTTMNGFNTRYLSSVNINDPKTGNAMTPSYQAVTSLPSSPGVLYYHDFAVCNGETPTSSTNARNYALWETLEGGAGYCVDNQ